MAKWKRKNVQGATQFNYEIDKDLAAQFRAFCSERNESVKGQLEIALRRHLETPPPPPVPPPPIPPLPPVEAAAPSPPKKRGRGEE